MKPQLYNTHNALHYSKNNTLTHRQEMPGYSRCGKACEDVVRGGEMREVRVSHGLTSTLTPHQYLTALCLCC